MTNEQFWEIIAASRSQWNPRSIEASQKRQLARLKELLSACMPDEIVAFDTIYWQLNHAAYHVDLWAAAQFYQGFCSDDGFTDFRSWLISQGREVYEAALQNADTLVDVFPDSDDQDVEFEWFGQVAGDVYEAVTGREMPDDDLPPSDTTPFSPELAGEPFPRGAQESEAEFARRMPRLYAKFGGSGD